MEFNEEIAEYTKSICSSMLGLDVEGVSEEESNVTFESTLTGCIHISGAWQGAVAVQFPIALGREVACIMFGLEDGQSAAGEVEDALGEIANMLGGNLKALLPAPSVLSLPVVIKGQDYEFRVPGAAPINQSWFRSPHGDFAVTLFRHEQVEAPAA